MPPGVADHQPIGTASRQHHPGADDPDDQCDQGKGRPPVDRFAEIDQLQSEQGLRGANRDAHRHQVGENA